MKRDNVIDIDFSLREKIEYIRLKNDFISSSHSFASLIIWSREMELKILIEDDVYAVKCNKLGENHWFIPCGNDEGKKRLINELLDELNGEKLYFHYIRDEDKAFLNEFFPNKFDFLDAPYDSEYILLKENHLKLAGKKYKYLRNQVNQVKRDYKLSVKSVFEYDTQYISDLTKNWTVHKNNSAWLNDIDAASVIINILKDIDGFGQVILVDDEPFAVVAGYPLSDNMVDFALAKQSFPLGGMGAFIKYIFINNLPEQYKYINIEEDLGIDGLRTMKHLLRPDLIINMYKCESK